MKNTLVYIFIGLAVMYFYKKGKNNENKDDISFSGFIASVQKGFHITMQSLSSQGEDNKTYVEDNQDKGWAGEKAPNHEMVSFTNQLSNFPDNLRKRQRGTFHLPTMISKN